MAVSFGFVLAYSASSSLNAAEEPSVDRYRVPDASESQLDAIPKNLARWHMGASLILTENDQFQRIQVPDVGFFDESVFLSDNSALTFSISRGEHNYIIDFGQFMTVSRFFLMNESAAGSLQLLSCDTLEPVNSEKWRPLTTVVEFDKGVIPSIAFSEVETRYVMVRFNIITEGLIGNFGATGPLTINQTKIEFGKGEEDDEVQKVQSPLIDYDFAGAHTGTRVVYVSGGSIADIFNLMDEDPTTNYNFPAGEESILILDLRKATQMRTVTSQFNTPVSGTLQVYMTDTLPTQYQLKDRISVATKTDSDGMVERLQHAASGSNYDYILASEKNYELVSVPESYFMEIEDSFKAYVTPDNHSTMQLMDDLEKRYVIYRFTPGPADQPSIQTAKFVPGASQLRTQQAQSGPMSFGSIQVIGDVEFDDIVLTQDDNPIPAVGGTPPKDPPIIGDPPPAIDPTSN